MYSLTGSIYVMTIGTLNVYCCKVDKASLLKFEHGYDRATKGFMFKRQLSCHLAATARLGMLGPIWAAQHAERSPSCDCSKASRIR
jgi:hypothetical protein